MMHLRIPQNSPAEQSAPAEPLTEPGPPRTWTVLGLLSMTALIFSYLGSYALADVLVHAEIVNRWPPDIDPRPRWLLASFTILMSIFMGLAALARWLSRRQLQAIDAMEDSGEPDSFTP